MWHSVWAVWLGCCIRLSGDFSGWTENILGRGNKWILISIVESSLLLLGDREYRWEWESYWRRIGCLSRSEDRFAESFSCPLFHWVAGLWVPPLTMEKTSDLWWDSFLRRNYNLEQQHISSRFLAVKVSEPVWQEYQGRPCWMACVKNNFRVLFLIN